MATPTRLRAPIDPLLSPDAGSTDLEACETRQLLNPVLGEVRIAAELGGGPSDGAAATCFAYSHPVPEAA